MSRVEIQLTMEATHILESQGQASAVSRVKIQLTTEATHSLESQGQAL